MEFYTALLIDDEAHCLRTLTQQLSWIDMPISIVGTAKSVEKAQEQLADLKQLPTFIFLDIHMGEEDGFSLLNRIDLSKSYVIFTTAFEEYAIQAFKERASGYLTKPISIEELGLLLKSLVTKNERPLSSQILKINSRNGLEVLDLSSIHYAEADGSYSILYMEDGSKRTISKNLKSLTESLKGSHFVRIHNKYLINVHEIKKVVKGDKPYVELKTVSVLPISRTKKEEVYKLIEGL